MARYEGMDDLLARVRERLGVDGVQEPAARPTPPRRETVQRDEQYTRALESALLLVRDVQTVGEQLTRELVEALTQEQRDELAGLITRAIQALRDHETAL